MNASPPTDRIHGREDLKPNHLAEEVGTGMAGPSKVEFPGKKRQTMKMRGTKQANEATAKKLARDLGQFLDNPRSHLPAMTFTGKLRWGRTDPVTKTLREIDAVVRNKDDTKWLAKRMMAKRGDPVAKAFAGSLHASHDKEFHTVGQFESGSFGSGSYVRRGDGKPGYLAGIQNFSNLTLRMLPWEDHAKHGMFFFSWDGGFVCTGPNPEPPSEWLDDVLKRSRFSFNRDELAGHDVWTTEGLDPKAVVNNTSAPQGYIALRFHHGPVVGLGLDAIATFTKKDTPFIHHLALSMLPPLLPSVLEVQASWVPDGWEEGRPLPSRCTEAVERVMDAWQGLTMNEGVVTSAIRQSVMEGIEDGLLIDERWLDGSDHQAIVDAMEGMAGSVDERALASELLRLAIMHPNEATSTLRIEAKGVTELRDEGGIRVMAGATCGDVLSALWEVHGLEGMAYLGLNGKHATTIWQGQCDQPKPFGNFLKGLDKAQALAQLQARFPPCPDNSGPGSLIHRWIVEGLTQGMGPVERQATARHPNVDEAAAGWAWLVAASRSKGQEWHFDTNARDRGGVWAVPTATLFELGKQLCDADTTDLERLKSAWNDAYGQLKTMLG